MIKKILLIGLLGTFIVPSVIAAPPSRANSNVNMTHSSLREQLDLTPEQREQAQILRKESQKKIEPYKKELNTLKTIQMSANSSAGETKYLKTSIEVLQQKIENIQLEHERKFIQILTPEQKTKYYQLKDMRKKKIEAAKSGVRKR